MGNKKVRGHGLHPLAFQSAIFNLDAHVSFVQSPEFDRAEVKVPDAVIDFLQADVPAGRNDGNVDPVAVPTNAAIGADVAQLVAVRVFERRESVGVSAERLLSFRSLRRLKRR